MNAFLEVEDILNTIETNYKRIKKEMKDYYEYNKSYFNKYDIEFLNENSYKKGNNILEIVTNNKKVQYVFKKQRFDKIEQAMKAFLKFTILGGK